MFQALVTLLFLVLAVVATGTIALLLRAEWPAIAGALGLGGREVLVSPVRVRQKAARRAVMLRVEVPSARQRAAA